MTEPPGHLARTWSSGKPPSASPKASPKIVAASTQGISFPPKELALDPTAPPVLDAPAPLVTSKEDVKRVRKVRFNPYVNRSRLPADEAEEALNARKSYIREAPYHDELWDGDEDAFREKELTADELWAVKFKSKVTSLPRKLKNPLKRGFRALKSFLPGSQSAGVDQISAHARKYKEEDVKDASGGAVFATAPAAGDSSAGGGGHLIKRKSSTSLRTLALYAEEVTPGTFRRYDELSSVIDSLASVPRELAAAEESLARHRKEVLVAKEELRKLRFEVPELERRLAKSANPRLMHYVQLSRDDKVKKLHHEFEVLKAKKEHEQRRVETLAMKIYHENERMEKLGEKLARLRGAETERTALLRFVVQECGKEDPNMVRLWETCDELLGRLEKEKAAEKRLRRTAERLRTFVLADRLETARRAVLEALELSKTVAQHHRQRRSITGSSSSRSGGGGVKSTSSAPQFVRYLTLSSSSSTALSASAPQQQSAPSSLPRNPKTSGSAPITSTSGGGGGIMGAPSSAAGPESTAIEQRKQALQRAREAIAQAMEDFELCLDDLELHVPSMWTSATLGWRREVPDVNLPEYFGSGTVARKGETLSKPDLLRKSSSSSSLAAASGEDPASANAQAEVRCSKKLGVINKITELAKRYAEFVEREATRTFMRVAKLSDQKKELDAERNRQEHIVFDAARARLLLMQSRAAAAAAAIIERDGDAEEETNTKLAPPMVEGSSGASDLSSPLLIASNQHHPLNKVRSTMATSVSSSVTGEDADFETSSMGFPPGVESPRSTDSRLAF